MKQISFQKNKNKRKKRSITCLIAICMLLSSSVMFAQLSVSGTVTDETGDPLIGVNVSIKGTTIGNITDIDGKYTLQAPGEQSILVFSFIGYKSAEVRIGSQRVINHQLIEDTQALEEVVIVGYGVQKKVTVTGSVASVTGEELKASPTTNLTNSMVGRMPGVIGFSRGDEPGEGGTEIRIRGTNSLGSRDPLIVIDGVPGREGGLNRLNPSEIENISVLKDAAAAIYGSRAANGVILVTTKRGKTGKPTISYQGNFGFSQAIRLPEMCNAYEYATLLNEISPAAKPYTDDDLRMFQDGSDPWGHPNTDWYEVGLRDAAPLYRHDVSMSGGSDKFKFYLNLAANGEDGLYKRSANRYDQYSIRANLDANITKYIDLSFGTIMRLEDRQYPTKSSGDIFSAFRRSKPTMPAFWPSGEPGPDIEYGDNPAVTGTKATGNDRRKDYYIQNTLRINIAIPNVEGLSFTGSGSYDKLFKQRKRFRKPFYLYSWDGGDDHVVVPAKKGWDTPELLQEHTDQTAWLLSGIINYNRTFGKHNISATVGMEAENKQQDFLSAFRKYFLADNIDEMDLGGMQDLENSGNSWEEARLNYFGRVSYNYLEKYLIEFVLRADGSYRFPKNKRYGYFPGVSAAWRASEEVFWKENVPFIEYFKLRGSVSQTGNDALLDADNKYDRSIQYLSTYWLNKNNERTSTNYYVFGTNESVMLLPSRTPNLDITWEVGTTYNLGLDFKFLQGRLTWESDIFYHKRTKMLILRNASLPEISGITLPRENLGKMENKGFETLMSWSDRAGNVDYNISVNATYAKNKILFWDETPGIPDYQKSTGKPIGLRTDGDNLYYQADGVFKDWDEVNAYPHWSGAQPGDIRFKDVNGDGKIDANDKVRSDKTSEPRFVGGINLGASWKGFDIRMLFQSALGSEVYIQTWSGTVGNFLKEFYDKRWTPENPNGKHPRVYERENQYWVNNRNTYWLRSGDYFRLKNMEIGYNFDFPALRNIGITALRVYTNASNIFTIDKLKVADPENDNKDLARYPQRRVYNFGVSATF